MGTALSDRVAAHGVSIARRADQRRGEQARLGAALLAVDALALVLGTGVATLARVAVGSVLPLTAFGLAERNLVATIMIVAVLLLLFRQQGLYDLDRILAGSREYARVAAAVTYGVLAALAASYFAGEGPLVSRSWLLLLWATCVGFACFGRFALRRVVRRLHRRGALRTRIAIVGASPVGVSIAERFEAAGDEGLDVVGFLDEYLPLDEPVLGDLRVIGRPCDLVRGARPDLADEYVLVAQALPYERQQQLMHLLAAREEPRLRVAMGSSELLTHGAELVDRAGIPLVTLGRARIVGLDAALKRTLDMVGAVVGLLILAPLMSIAIIRARLAGERVVLQRSTVRGRGEHDVAFWLLAPRVASRLPVRGAPALLAVLAGGLSLVGPRPIPSDDAVLVDEQLGLTATKPGLTGPWRLSGPRASLGEQAASDLAYVRSYSIWEDLRILWASLRTLWRSHPMGMARWQHQSAALDAPATRERAAGPSPGRDMSRSPAGT